MVSKNNCRVLVTLPKDLLELLYQYQRLNRYSTLSRACEAILRDYLINMQGFNFEEVKNV